MQIVSKCVTCWNYSISEVESTSDPQSLWQQQLVTNFGLGDKCPGDISSTITCGDVWNFGCFIHSVNAVALKRSTPESRKSTGKYTPSSSHSWSKSSDDWCTHMWSGTFALNSNRPGMPPAWGALAAYTANRAGALAYSPMHRTHKAHTGIRQAVLHALQHAVLEAFPTESHLCAVGKYLQQEPQFTENKSSTHSMHSVMEKREMPACILDKCPKLVMLCRCVYQDKCQECGKALLAGLLRYHTALLSCDIMQDNKQSLWKCNTSG